MKSKFLALGKILLSFIGVALLFFSVVGIGNYFQSHNLKYLGNIFMLLFPFTIYIYVYFLNKKLLNLKPLDYGFTFKKFFSNFCIGFLSSVSIMFVVILFLVLLLDVNLQFYGLRENFLKSLLEITTTLIIVGIWEEFYFRGFVFTILSKTKFGFHLSALISSILFSVIHWYSFDMNETSWLWYIGIVIIGYILVIIYTLTKSIWSVVVFHFFWNFLNTLLNAEENEIGVFSISNYHAYSKNIDNVEVCILAIVLIGLLFAKQKKYGVEYNR